MRPGYEGVGPTRVRLLGSVSPEGQVSTVLAELSARFGASAETKVLSGEVFTADGAVIDATTVLAPGSDVYLYRELPEEVEVPFDIPILYRDDDIVVVDKPHFLATMPRGGHVAQTAVVKLRRKLELPELSPAHRLDRLTAGVLLFTARREVRGRYQSLFAAGVVRKTYLAAAVGEPNRALPTVLRDRIVKQRGVLQATIQPGEPNAETLVELQAQGNKTGHYRLTPHTGRTHQLRVHMASLGVPIIGDSLYPEVLDVASDDFSTPLQLLAHTLEFEDPLTGQTRQFISGRKLG